MADAIHSIYFDLGKVLFDFDFDNLFAHVPERLRRSPDLVQQTAELARQLECGIMQEEAFFDGLLSLYPEFEDPADIRRAWCEVFRPIDENIALVRQLAACGRYRLGVISNTNAPHMEELQRLSDVFDCFDHLSLSHRVGCMKPDEAIYQYALQGLDANPEKSLFFDDRSENVFAARRIGFHAVHVMEPEVVYDELKARSLI